VSNWADVVHEHVGRDALEVEKKAVEQEKGEQGVVRLVGHRGQVHEQHRRRDLHHHRGHACVKLQLSWTVKIQ